MPARQPFAIALVVGVVSLAAAACGDSGGDEGREPTPPVSGSAETTYGAIERFPGGTAVVNSPHSLVAITCTGSTITVTTTAATFTGSMDCTAMPPEDIIVRYVDKAIVITVGGGRLKIENPEAGSLDFPATDVTS